jgi:exodeoxyribonuclease V gamma subunit
MSLQLKISDSINSLAERLADDCLANQKNVFNTLCIATQTSGMKNWLKYNLASHSGILANYKFIQPNDFINELYSLFGGERKQFLKHEHLKWLIYSALNDDNFTNEFPVVAKYYSLNKQKRIALASKIADLFDQYFVYRSELIKNWESIDFQHEMDNDAKWQSALWKLCIKKINNDFIIKSTIEDFIISAIKEEKNQKLLKENYSSVYLFSIAVLSPVHLKFYSTISAYIDVHLYISDPAFKQKWFSDDTENLLLKINPQLKREFAKGKKNELLNSWGKLIEYTMHQLFNVEVSIEHLTEKNKENSTLLQKIQNDIHFNLSENQRNKIDKLDLNDGSLTINACYTPAREVEVLYNYLVKNIEQSNSGFSVRSMLVMVTDINTYAPFIKAIFDNAPYKIPYTILDQRIEDVNPIISSLKSILSLTKENFTSENVFQLLTHELIRKKFGIYDTELIHAAIKKAGIRFGNDGDPQIDTQFVSFKNGLRRLLLGYCMHGEQAYTDIDEDIYPVELADGNDARQIISFCHFVNVLFEMLELRSDNRNLLQWTDYVIDIIHHFIYDDTETENEFYEETMFQLRKLNEAGSLVNDEFSFEVFSGQLLQTITNEFNTSFNSNRGIIFCSFLSMRSIPFDYIAMLGLDSDKFPRNQHALQFDLINKYPEIGDRNIKDNDKHLFLETLLCANKKLYISYLGRDSSANKILLPSVVLDELIDYVSAGLDEKIDLRKEFVTLHPLHNFSNKYNASNNKLYSYTGNNQSDLPGLKSDNGIKKEPITEIDIEKLISFFKDPFKYHYNKTLSIYYEDNSYQLAETELFSLETLQKWKLKTEFVKLDDDLIENCRIELLKKGELPLKNFSIVTKEQIKNEIDEVKELFLDLSAGQIEKTEKFTIPLKNKISLKGNINNIYGDTLIEISFSKKEYKYLLSTYIKHLVICITGFTKSTVFISNEKKSSFSFKLLTKAKALKYLEVLVDYFLIGQQTILPYCHLNEDKSKITDETTLISLVNNSIFGFNSIDNIYFINEFRAGFFNDTKNKKDFIEITKEIHEMLQEAIPNYSFETK